MIFGIDVSRETDVQLTLNTTAPIGRWVRLLGLVPAFLLAGAVALGITIDRQNVLRTAADESRELSEVAKIRVEETLAAVEQVMTAEAVSYSVQQTAASGFAVPTSLGVVALGFIDADGHLLATTGGDPTALHMIGTPRPGTMPVERGSVRLQVGLVAQADGNPFLLLTRRIDNDSRAARSVVALLSGNALLDSFARLPLAAGTRISIVARNGAVAAALPPSSTAIIDDLAALRPRTPLTIHSQQDHATRIVSAETIGSGDFQVIVGLDLRDVLHDWTTRSLWLGAIGLLTSIGLGWLQLRVMHGQRTIWTSTTDYARRLKLLAEASPRLGHATGPDRLVAGVAALARELIPCHDVRVNMSPRTAGSAAHDCILTGSEDASAPLVELQATVPAHDGRPLGTIAVRRRAGGPADALDEAALVQLARIAGAEFDSRNLVETAAQATRQAEHGLRAAEAARREMEQILGSISDGAALVDRELRLLYVNGRAETLLGRPAAALLGQCIAKDETASEQENGLGKCLQQAMRSGTRLDAKACPMPSGGWSDITIYPHRLGFTVYMRDVTQEIALENRQRETVKMEALGRLAGGIAHDFNNLLTVLSGSLELLESEALPDTAGHDALQMAMRATANARELTQRLMNFSRRNPPAACLLDTAQALSANGRVIRRTLANVDVSLGFPSDVWPVFVDPVQFDTALLNLAINAGDAMPHGGRLRIEAANVTVAGIEDRVRHEVPDGDYVVVALTDEGVGIPPDILPHVFEPFFTTKFPGKGTGLGLAMVHGFARQSGGTVQIASRPDPGAPHFGTTVSLILPRATHTQTSPPRAPRAPATDPEPGTGTILVVEDEPVVRAHFELLLSDLGYTVQTAASGDLALALIGGGLVPDLLLTDVVLTGQMTGIKLAHAARHRIPDLAVIFASGYPRHPEVTTFETDAMLLVKPFSRTELAAAVRERLAREPELA